jgi:D-sedoheptulose 7-phosphate isomerase
MDLEAYKEEGVAARKNIDNIQIKRIADGIISSFKKGGKLVVFGNGGSAADAQHFVAELTGHFMKERAPLPAIALTTNTSALTAIGNDYSYRDIFSRQVQAICYSNDYVVGISTSGNSENVLTGIEEANKIGAYTLGFTGKTGGKLTGICREVFHADTDTTSIIQEVHITAIHMICGLIDEDY